LDKHPLTQIGRVMKKQTVGGREETVRVPFDPDAPAANAFRWQMADTLPAIELTSVYEGKSEDWTPQKDLLNSDGDKTEFVAEIENDGTAHVRFGDNEHGRRPDSGTTFTAEYRVGNGVAGNVGADSLVHIVSDDSRITSVRNPIAAHGGVEPESIEDVRQRAPYAFRTQERAVTANDYATMAQRDVFVQRAAGTFRWTGSWRTMFVTIDRFGVAKVDDAFKQEIEDELEPYRMAGQDLDVNGPIYVSLEIEMQVCVKPDYFRSAVIEARWKSLAIAFCPTGASAFFIPTILLSDRVCFSVRSTPRRKRLRVSSRW
jgi:predicted phage baseplate assembly protein